MVGGRPPAAFLAVAAPLILAAMLAAVGLGNPASATPAEVRVAFPADPRTADLQPQEAASSNDPPSCVMPAVATKMRCTFTCVAGQQAHAFMEGQGTITATCGRDECKRATTVMGGCGFQSRFAGRGACVVEGLGNGRCYSFPIV